MIRLSSTVMSRRFKLAGDDGLSTAELLGNAALAIGALVVIWGLLRALGVDVIEWIEEQIFNPGT